MHQVDGEIQALLKDKNAFPASIAPTVALYLYDLVLSEKPLMAVEVGCCRGFSTLHIGKALLDSGGSGKLISFDLAPQEAAERVRRAGLDGIVEFVTGNSAREGERFFAGQGQVIDFLFIDGDHTRRGCFRDAEVFIPHLKIGGLLILHDIYPVFCGWLGPRYLVDCLQQLHDPFGKPCFSIQEIPDLDEFGIAVCIKQADFAWTKSFSGYLKRSRLAQLVEIANFEGKRTPREILSWGLSKWRRIACHW